MNRPISKRVIPVLLAFTMLGQNCFAFEATKSDAQAVNDAIIRYEAKLDSRTETQRQNEDAAILEYQDLLKSVATTTFMSNHTQYADYYGGAYINDDGNLVVKVVPSETKSISQAKNEIAAITGNPNIIVESTATSLNKLIAIKNLIDNFVLTPTESLQSNAVSVLQRAITGVMLSEKNSQIIVQINNLEQEKIETFYDCFGTLDCVAFEEGEFAQLTNTWHPGNEIYCIDESSNFNDFSIGWPAYFYNENGDKVRGFVTGGHCVDTDEDVYAWAYNDNTVIGSCVISVFGGDCDGALVELADGESISTTTAYNGITLRCTSYMVPLEGSTVYKEGRTTGLTQGQIISTDHTITYSNPTRTVTNLYYTTAQCDGGDSGGVAYVKSGSYYYAIGQMSGKQNSTGYSYISNMFDTMRELDCDYISANL